MKAFLRPCWPLLFLLVWAAPEAQAQLVTGPLPTDPARAPLRYSAAGPARRGTADALGLPFFDDFTTPREGLPSPVRWLPTGGAYVSNRLAVAPPSRGAATLDGLRRNGIGYAPNSSGFGPLDTLTSQPINLSGLSTADNVRLSFAWQAGTVGGPARRSSGSTPVQLELDFRSGADPTFDWKTVWKQDGSGAVQANGQVPNFRQVILALDQAAYFRADFQFRFRATGSGSTGRDAWSVDYVLLDQNRPANDTTFRDVATSRGLSSPLRRYAAMPVWQFNAAANPAEELKPELELKLRKPEASFFTTLNNLALPGTTPTPITWQGTVRELGGAFGGAWAAGSRSVTAGARQDSLFFNARTAPLPVTPNPKTLRYELALITNEANPRLNSLPNDSLSRDVDLRDYYAYDDGTAEGILALPAISTGPPSYLAYRIDLNQDDQVRGLRLYPVFVDPGARAVTVAIWDHDNANNRPAAQPRAGATVAVSLTASQVQNQAYVDVLFAQPIAVGKGSFWIGYGQPSQGRFLHYGHDLNSAPPANYLYQNTQGAWQPAIYSPVGAPMMRPLMTNFVATATAPGADPAAAFRLWPNPAGRGPVRVSGPRFQRAELLSVLGQTLWLQPATDAGQPLLRLPAALPAGLYLVRLTLADGRAAVRRLVVE